MQSARVPLVLTLATVLLAVVRVAMTWSELPPTMASHFGASGQPDSWQSRDGFFLAFGGLTGFTMLVLLTVPLWLRGLPTNLINLPNRDYWLVPERKDETLARMGGFMNWMAFMTCALMVVVLELVMQANIERRGLANGPFLIAMVAYFVGVGVWLVALYRAFRLPADGSRRALSR
jgi:uncharacterized membrane protein